MSWTPALRATLTRNLSTFTRVAVVEGERRAAVVIAVIPGDGGAAYVPLFLRTKTLRRHADQIGLPGGRIEAGETPAEAGLRELEEELSIARSRVELLGTLDDFPTRSGFVITPLVAWSQVSTDHLTPSLDEVAELYLLRVDDLGPAVAAASPGASSSFALHLAWGATYAPTAAMLYQFHEVALRGRQVRVADFYQPPFTWT